MKNVIGEHYNELAARARSTGPSASRTSSRGSSARSRTRPSSRRSGARVAGRSSARSTGVRPSASSTRSRRSSLASRLPARAEQTTAHRGGRKRAPRAARSGGRRRARARSGRRRRARRARARRAFADPRGAGPRCRPARGRSRSGRGNQRESWFRRRASCALPVRSGSAAKSASRSRSISSNRARCAGSSNSKCQSVGGRPHLADAVVRARDPDDLTGRDRLALGRRREGRSRSRDRRRSPALARGPRARKCAFASWCQTVPSTPDAYVPGCARTASTPASRRTRVVGVPAEDLVGEDVEVLVDAEAPVVEELVERDAVRPVRLAGEQVSLHRRREPA